MNFCTYLYSYTSKKKIVIYFSWKNYCLWHSPLPTKEQKTAGQSTLHNQTLKDFILQLKKKWHLNPVKRNRLDLAYSVSSSAVATLSASHGFFSIMPSRTEGFGLIGLEALLLADTKDDL